MPESTPDSNRVFEIFNQAADLPASRIGSFLARSCVDDTVLRHRVEELLASERAPVADFLDKPVPALPVLRPSVVTKRPTSRSIGPGTLIGSYRIVTEIGRGGMGVVYLAEHEELAKGAVVKVLSQSCARNEQMGQRFITEAKAAASIRHPGIVDVFDVGRHPQTGELFILMEYLAGEPLSTRIKSAGSLSQEVALAFISQASNALAAVHDMGIVHRDLKPDNMFVVPDPEVTHGERIKLLDFGIAKLRERPEDSRTQSGVVMGTPPYMSPEQCEGRTDIDQRSDLYAMGVILFQMLAGRRPFEDMSPPQYLLAHVRGTPPPLQQFCPSSWPDTAALVDRLLAKKPDQRFPSAHALRDRVQELLERHTNPGRNTPAGKGRDGDKGGANRSRTVEIVFAEDVTPAVPDDAGACGDDASSSGGAMESGGDRAGDSTDNEKRPSAVPLRAGPDTVSLGRPRSRPTAPPPLPVDAVPGTVTEHQADLMVSPDTAVSSEGTLQRSVLPVGWLVQIGSVSSLAVALAVVFFTLRWPSPGVESQPAQEPVPVVESPLDGLLRAFDMASMATRQAIVEAIRLAAPTEAAPVLYRALEQGETAVRIDAVRALCDLQWTETASKIRRALSSGVGAKLEVHMAACLAELGDWDSLDILIDVLKSDNNPNIQLLVAYALALSGRAQVARPVLERARTNLPGSRNWLLAHRALVKIGDEQARNALLRACARSESGLVVQAGYILAAAGGRNVDSCGLASLLRNMQDRAFTSRGAAALALARLGDAASLGHVDRGLDHPLASERRLAIAVASRMAHRGGRRFAERIALMAKHDQNASVRLMARVALVGLLPAVVSSHGHRPYR